MRTLQELIRARMDERGWKYADLAHRCGDALSRSRWQQLGTGVRLKAFPEVDTVRLMARALEVEETAVVLAAAKSLGLDVRRHGPDLAQLMPAGTDQLSPQVRDAILAVIRATVGEALSRGDDAESRHADGQGHDPTRSVLEWSTPGHTARRGKTSSANDRSHGVNRR